MGDVPFASAAVQMDVEAATVVGNAPTDAVAWLGVHRCWRWAGTVVMVARRIPVAVPAVRVVAVPRISVHGRWGHVDRSRRHVHGGGSHVPILDGHVFRGALLAAFAIEPHVAARRLRYLPRGRDLGAGYAVHGGGLVGVVLGGLQRNTDGDAPSGVGCASKKQSTRHRECAQRRKE